VSGGSLPKRLRPERPSRAVLGSERDLRVLSELAWAGMLTTGQVERLCFPSRRRAQRRLRALLDGGLVQARLQAEAMHRDNLWTLTRHGIEFLTDRGKLSASLAPLRPNVRSQKLHHALAVRDVATSLLVARDRGLLEVRDLRLDSELVSEPTMIVAGLVPDGLAEIRLDGQALVLFWEVACLAQPFAQVKAKLLLYERACASGSSFFRQDGLAILIVAESRGRLENAERFGTGLVIAGRLRFLCLEDALDPAKVAAVLGPRAWFDPIA